MPPRQLPLPFHHEPDFSPADFIAAPPNEAARCWLARPGDWPHGRLALWGEAGVGKSHLLHIWARDAAAAVLSGPRLRGLVPAPRTSVAVDDADLAAEEASLLHLLNAAHEAGHKVLLASREPPGRWNVRLPDLASRLASIHAVCLAAPDEALLGVIFARLLSSRQLVLAPALQEWLLARLPRHPAALAEAVARLDRASLAAGRRVGRQLALAALDSFLEDDDLMPFSPGSPSLL
ncbi:MAG TPA: chromosomal replication initiator DnaA [Acetobacteraceae bacterium]|nr:chromosomal replication initiator DnaA [Acetobacteraceae bacterium]